MCMHDAPGPGVPTCTEFDEAFILMRAEAETEATECCATKSAEEWWPAVCATALPLEETSGSIGYPRTPQWGGCQVTVIA